MIYTVTLNPAIDKTVTIPDFCLDSVNRVVDCRLDPGGKGINVSKVLLALGQPSVVFTLLAGDTGRTLRAMLAQAGLSVVAHELPGQTRQNLKVVDPARHSNTDINEPGAPASAAALAGLRQDLLARVQPGDLVVLAGSLPAGAPPDTYAGWVSACQAAGAKVFVDADGPALREAVAARPYLIKPNESELVRLAGCPLPTETALVAAGRALLAAGVHKVVISRGAQGALYLSEEETFAAEGLSVPVGSTVGAGDSMVAALALAEARGLPWREAARLSTAAGAANVSCQGTEPAPREAVEALLERVVLRPAQ